MSAKQSALPKVMAFALLCVAASSTFVFIMNWRLTNILAAPDWCARAIRAEQLAKAGDQTSCGELLLKQVNSLALNNHIYAGVIGLCLLALMVIVVASGNLTFSVSKTGASGSLGRNPEAQAAGQVADAAVAEADAIAEGSR